MKTVTKQGPRKINQTGILIVLQKQWHRIAFITRFSFSFILGLSVSSLIRIENHIPASPSIWYNLDLRVGLVVNLNLFVRNTAYTSFQIGYLLKLYAIYHTLSYMVSLMNKTCFVKTSSWGKLTYFQISFGKIAGNWAISNKVFERKWLTKFIFYRKNAYFDGPCPNMSIDIIVADHVEFIVTWILQS